MVLLYPFVTCLLHSDVSGGTSEVLLRMSGRKVSWREVFHSVNCRFRVHEVFVLKWSLRGPKFQFPLSLCLEAME